MKFKIDVDSTEDRKAFADIVSSSDKYIKYCEDQIIKLTNDFKEEYPKIESTDIFGTYFLSFSIFFYKFLASRILKILMEYDQEKDLDKKKEIKDEVEEELHNIVILNSFYGILFALHIILHGYLTFSFYKRSQQQRVNTIKFRDRVERRKQIHALPKDCEYIFYDHLQYCIYDMLEHEKELPEIYDCLLLKIINYNYKDWYIDSPDIDGIITSKIPLDFDYLEYEKFRETKATDNEE